ncbi:MAG: DNA mismatch repair endonuclease MutL [Planctomycetes bacterium]|nr:DNA mismatch repair endonuclease MutL [Planctomycetota bacterium]
MPSIHVLSDALVKKIAAGEVLERPASAVKELMENAVDAGATHVRVEVKDGGKALIRVTDDGCGMSPDDLRLAVTPHATSKVVHEDDLYRIASLGFRGEALASIGAVSRLQLRARTHESDEGAEIVVVGEQVETNRAAGCAAGTSVEVRDLFFNVPARRKFLRTPSTEYGYINTQFTRIALSHPSVAMELVNNGRVVHRLAGGSSIRERIGKLFSSDLSDALIEFKRGETERGKLAIEGYACPPADSRSSSNWQYTFLNRRFIRDRFLQHAIKEAYRGLMEHNRFAVVFLFLSIDPELVDVNVHPTKIEVRWQDSGMIHSQVLSALREALSQADLTPALDTERAGHRPLRSPPDPEEQARLRQAFIEDLKQAPRITGLSAIDPGLVRHPQGVTLHGEASGVSRGTEDPSLALGARLKDAWHELYRDTSPTRDDATRGCDGVRDERGPLTHGTARRAIQVHNTYLVCETEEGMVIIDQHALHERIIYDQLKQRITAGKLESQRLLLPETLNVTPAQMAVLETQAELLDQLGLEIAPFGRDAVAIHSFPALLKDTDTVAFVRDLLDKLEEQGNQPHTEVLIHEVLDMMSCKAAVKAGDPLTPEEIDALISRKELVEKSSNCPHGRPTTLRLTVKDLERQFKRT